MKNSMGGLFYLLLIVFLYSCTPIHADNDKYSFSRINIELLENANAVVRNSSLIFKVSNIEKAHLYCKYVVTILNKNGQPFGELDLKYDKFRKINNIKGMLYDAFGNEIRKLDKNEIHDYSLISWATLYSDSRVRSAELYHNEFPYTVEYEYEITYKGYIGWPQWFPEREGASVEYSSYNVILPAGSKLRYHSNHLNIKPEISKVDKKYVSYKWEIDSLLPFEREPYGPLLSEQLMSLTTAPSKFKMDDYEGSLVSWNTFGKWLHDLSKGKQSLPEPVKKEMLNIIAGISDRKEKIKRIYQYMQSKTRYVNIKVGIGGWQPMSAERVHNCGYGDCKALTNFMISLLECVDIAAYPAFIYRSDKPSHIEKAFPCNEFNHVIACIPCETDTVWLECTSQTYPFGHIGADNESRYALLILDDGGKLVKTPTSETHHNKQIRKATVILQENGNGVAQVETKYTGNQQDAIGWLFSEMASNIFEEWLKGNINIPSFRLKSKSFQKNGQDNSATSLLKLDLVLPRYAAASGNRLFFNPNLMEQRTFVPREVESRKYPVLFDYPYCDIDTIYFRIPAGYILEARPTATNIKTDYARFQSNISLSDSVTIQYVRLFEIQSKKLPSRYYEQYRNFLKSVIQTDRSRIVLVKK